MKKTAVFILLALIFTAMVNAMPPHPNIVEELKKTGTLDTLTKQFTASQSMGKDAPTKSFPTTGTNKVLVLLIDFSDALLATGSTTSFYDSLFTDGPGSNGLGWKQYYMDMSNNKLILEFDVVYAGNAAEVHDYYGENSGGIAGNDSYPGTLVYEAANAVDGSVDFSNYDNDGDGYVDAVVVIHQGQGEEASGSAGVNGANIWSHRWNLYSAAYYEGFMTFGDYLTLDGVKINDYAIQPEYVYSAGDSTIGVFAHEFGHILGLPDLYDTDYDSDGIGSWGLMSAGSWLGPSGMGAQPAPLTAWCRAQLGWLTASPVAPAALMPAFPSSDRNRTLIIIAAAGALLALIMMAGGRKRVHFHPAKKILLGCLGFSILLLSTCGDKGSADTIDLADVETSYKGITVNINSSEYLLLENKVKKNDTWTEYIPGQGLLIYHVDNDLIAARYSNNEINNYGIDGDLGMAVVEADGNDNLLDASDYDSGSATDPFYSGNVDRYTNIESNSGGTASFEISNISTIGSVISFKVIAD